MVFDGTEVGDDADNLDVKRELVAQAQRAVIGMGDERAGLNAVADDAVEGGVFLLLLGGERGDALPQSKTV